MSSAKHTPGPWEILPTHKSERYGYAAGARIKVWSHGADPMNDMPICGIHISNATEDRALATARLIAAAPDLLAALKGLTQLHAPGFEDGTHSPYWALNEDDRGAILAAIAKAEGVSDE